MESKASWLCTAELPALLLLRQEQVLPANMLRAECTERRGNFCGFLSQLPNEKGLLCVWNKREHVPSRHETSPCYKHKVNAILVLEAGQLAITVFLEGFVVRWLECFFLLFPHTCHCSTHCPLHLLQDTEAEKRHFAAGTLGQAFYSKCTHTGAATWV